MTADAERLWNRSAADYLFMLRVDRGWSLREMEKETGIRHSSIQNAEREDTTVTIGYLSRIAEALDLHLPTMLVEIARRMDGQSTVNIEVDEAYDIR